MNDLGKDKDMDNFLEEIKASLTAHEEPYVEGAWEKFQKFERQISPVESERVDEITPIVLKERNRVFPIWYASIAASLLILLGGAWLFWPSNLDKQDIKTGFEGENLAVQQGSVQKRDLTDPYKNTPLEVDGFQGKQVQTTSDRQIMPVLVAERSLPTSSEVEGENFQSDFRSELPDIKHAQFAAISNHEFSSSFGPKIEKKLVGNAVSHQIEQDLPDFLIDKQQQIAGVSHTPQSSSEGLLTNLNLGSKVVQPWQFGLHFNSGFTTDRLNYGGGVQVAYQLTDKVSIRSGLSIDQLGLNKAKQGFFDQVAARMKGDPVDVAHIEHSLSNKPGYSEEDIYSSPNVPGKEFGANMLAGYRNKAFIGSTSQVLALDIPLEFKVDWTKNFYSSVGVSFVGVLNENRTDYFREVISVSKVQNTSIASKPIGLEYDIEVNTVKNASNQNPIEGRNFATGYFNMSLGRSIPLNSNFKIGLEPYVKVPIGGLKRVDMNFTNIGLKLVTDF